jgi:hypothetical protein
MRDFLRFGRVGFSLMLINFHIFEQNLLIMLNFNFRTSNKIKESKKVIDDFESHFKIVLPNAYKHFITYFDVEYKEDYVMDSYIDQYFRLAPASQYIYFTLEGKKIGSIDFWNVISTFTDAIRTGELQEHFENELNFTKEGYYAIGKYLNYNFVLLGIDKSNYDKIYIYDSDNKRNPILAANNIFELFFQAHKDLEIDNSYFKYLGKKYYSKVDLITKVPLGIVDRIISFSKSNFRYIPLNELVKNTILHKYNVTISEEAYAELKKIHDSRKNDPIKNYNGQYYDEFKFRDYLDSVNNELSINPIAFPDFNEKIMIFVKQKYLDIIFFFDILDYQVRIFTVMERSEIFEF